MCKALLSYFRRRGVHNGVYCNWKKFFLELDVDNSGKITFEELDAAVRGRLGAKISRYELRLFWRRVDADGSGLLTMREFSLFMYRTLIKRWVMLSTERLEACVSILSEAFERWYHAGGNWFKIFRQFDANSSGELSFEELTRCVREPLPGLGLTRKDISDVELQGLWKAIDIGIQMEVSVQRFMAFMRKHGAAHSIHRITSYSKQKRGLDVRGADLGETPVRTKDELRQFAKQLDVALQCYWERRGVHTNTHSAGGNWDRFFREVDLDGSGRLLFPEFQSAILEKLAKWIVREENDSTIKDDIRALWAEADPNGSNEVTAAELTQSLYRIELSGWPDADDDRLQRIVSEMNAAHAHLHHSSGNWSKIFKICDPEQTGSARFDHLRRIVRCRYPFLQIPAAKVSDDDLRALWKMLDQNASGDTSMKEFMLCMRKYGAKHSMHKATQYSLKMRGEDATSDEFTTELAAAPHLDKNALLDVANRLCSALINWLSRRGVKGGSAASSLGNPRLWDELFAFVDKDRSSRISFKELVEAVKNILRAEKIISVKELGALWRAADANLSGEINSKEFGETVYKLQIDAWPDLTDAELTRLIEVLNAAADRWHRCSGNWYKVFAIVDEDRSGVMHYDELQIFIRRPYPSLSISASQVDELALQGLWRALDTDRSGKVTIKEFMAFMRKHAARLAMHKTTSYSLQKRGVTRETEDPGPTPERTEDQLRATAQILEETLAAYWAKQGVHVNMSGSWQRLFKEADVDNSGRLSFYELERTLRSKLLRNEEAARKGWVVKGVSHDDLLGLWGAVDANGSGEVTAAEWYVRLYRLELEMWPDASEEILTHTVDTMHEAADRWHRAGGNWFKVFRLIDSDLSGEMQYDELKQIVRRPLPCLAIPAKALPDGDIQALWKALDRDRSGMVTVQEFMIFMRQHGTKKQLHKKLKPQRAKPANTLELCESQVKDFCYALGEQTSASIAAYYEQQGVDYTGNVSEWDFMIVVRELLGIGTAELDDDAVFAVWKLLDTTDAGVVSVDSLLKFEG
jgi:Ca2+-binding EF-hand superfamily protein